MEQEIKKLTKAVDKLARELKRYNDTKNAGPAGVPGKPGVPGKLMDPTQLPEVKISVGQRNEGLTCANMLARAMSHDEKMDALKNAYFQSDKQVREKLDKIELERRKAHLDKLFGGDF